MSTDAKLGMVLGLGLVLLTAVTYAPKGKSTGGASPNSSPISSGNPTPRISLPAGPVE